MAYAFLAPALLLLGVFTFYPIAVGTGLAFFDYSMIRHTAEGELMGPQFVGLGNFRRLADDPYFYTALVNSLLYLLIVPAIQFASIVLAVMVNQPLRGRNFFRTAFYIPVITSVVVVGITWKWVLRSDGLANFLLGRVGLGPVGWLTDESVALFSVMFVTLWQGLGYYMILYLAGLQSIDPHLEEAARLDGASAWQVLTRITIPLLRPTVALCTIISCISALKVFGEIYVMTQGGPKNATLTTVFYIFQRGFEEFQMGYAAAVALVLAGLVGIISYVNVRYFKEGGLSSYY